MPFLAFLFVVAVDFARIFYHSLTLTSCARNGALYACDALAASESPYKSTAEAALADATNLSPQPTVASTSGVDAGGESYVEVTVSHPFQTITRFPGLPSTIELTRRVRMRTVPAVP
jgi:hypothetical protein